ncbi:MAG TPA: hypothetical protein VKQ31_06730 [Steroidobacteraceae bacterium]|nr:hypothetical protein [Steroidobacteraceae bacterium]
MRTHLARVPSAALLTCGLLGATPAGEVPRATSNPGVRILRRFIIVTDFAPQRIWLEPHPQ